MFTSQLNHRTVSSFDSGPSSARCGEKVCSIGLQRQPKCSKPVRVQQSNAAQQRRVIRQQCQALSTDVSRPTHNHSQEGHSDPTPVDQPVRAKNGVLLLNLGGPESLEDVRPFLYNLFADPDIIRLPSSLKFLQPLLANVIASLRSPKSSEGYAAIGGGSPLRRITDEQAQALGQALRRKGLDAEVYVAMRYWHPYTEEALQHVVRDGIQNLVILPLYPQFSISTSGSSLRLLERLFKHDPVLQHLKHTVIPSWYQRPGYVSAMVDLIEAELDKFDKPHTVNVFFSAHGVPKSYVEEAGDPYKEEMEECIDLIMAEMRRRGRDNQHTLAYQSRVGPVEWLQPYTDDSIRELGRQGVESLLAVPISFVSEHIETLEEIDMEYRELALESGVKKWGRVPALNTHPKFIEDLADAVVEALPYVGVIAGAPSDSLVPMGEYGVLGSWFHEAWFHSQRWARRHQRGAKSKAGTALEAEDGVSSNSSSSSSDQDVPHAANVHDVHNGCEHHDQAVSAAAAPDSIGRISSINGTIDSSSNRHYNGHAPSTNSSSSSSNRGDVHEYDVAAAAPAGVPKAPKRTVTLTRS